MNKSILLLLSVITLMAYSCSLIFDPDLSKDKVNLISPYDGLNTFTQNTTFWWDYVDQADHYNLLIVSPSWDSVAKLVLDTNLTTNKFTISLLPGNYNWGVSAYNSGSATPYAVFSLRIDTTNSLGGQSLVLKSPEDNINLNKRNVLFSWYTLQQAKSYIFELRDSTWTTQIIPPVYTSYDTIHLVLEEGRYQWGVKGINDLTSTPYSTRLITIDTTAPGIPSLLNPVNNGDTLSPTDLVIRWKHTAKSLAAISDSVIIGKDSIIKPLGVVGAVFTSKTELSVSSYSNGKYFVKIKSIDAAGNESAYCPVRKFYIEK